MNPHQKNKVDISAMTPEEQKIFRMYGKLPNKKDLLQNKLSERKYFDSGDYALSKAGKASDVGVTQIGREHPNPDTIPHLSSPLLQHERNGSMSSVGGAPSVMSPSGGVSPVKESSFLNRETSIDDVADGNGSGKGDENEEAVEEETSERRGIPIRGAQ